jgi:hypothetical protein
VSVVQQKYEELIDAMPVHVKVARAGQMYHWYRDWIMRQILAEKGPLPDERLRLEVAMRIYGHEESVRHLIEKSLCRVSD